MAFGALILSVIMVFNFSVQKYFITGDLHKSLPLCGNVHA